MRNQDWVIKIDYQDGNGTGNILWRLGAKGDFTVNNTDPYPWFSGQHEAGFEDGGRRLLSLFDNGNTRVGLLGGNSRGQLLDIDQQNMVVTLPLNVDLGSFAPSIGSAQRMKNGNYCFQPSNMFASPTYFQAIEVTPAGTFVYELQGQTVSYRSWFMPNLYTPPIS
jgi:hypothetical protein